MPRYAVRGSLVVSVLNYTIAKSWVRVSLLTAGCRVATVDQLLLAPWAWAYSTYHPYMVGTSSTSLSAWCEGGVSSTCVG